MKATDFTREIVKDAGDGRIGRFTYGKWLILLSFSVTNKWEDFTIQVQKIDQTDANFSIFRGSFDVSTRVKASSFGGNWEEMERYINELKEINELAKHFSCIENVKDLLF